MFKLQFETDNEAFDDFEEECAQILRQIAVQVSEGYTEGQILDTNGNHVGYWQSGRMS